ncbi:MAG TPA: NADP-dependent oxidoreductase [Caulobacteraceae bacterium]
MTEANRQILLDQLPQGPLAPEHFRLIETPPPQAVAGEVLVRTRYISLDAANRAWMMGATYRSALGAGQVMAGTALAEVVDSKASGLKPGDLVSGDIGWQDYAALPANALTKLPNMEPLSHLMSVYGIAGLTAYFGLLDCGQPKAGETVVVSAAAGSVGSLVGQIAKIKGCRVVGIAGGPDKCAWLTGTLGFDAAIDYKAGDLRRQVREAVPEGIDVYFDNVGGEILDTCLFNMKVHGRVVGCGAISAYDTAAPPPPLRAVPGLILMRRLTMRGFLVTDFEDQRARALKDLEVWVASGQLKIQEDILEGLENTPQALIGLLHGDNLGKRMVRV